MTMESVNELWWIQCEQLEEEIFQLLFLFTGDLKFVKLDKIPEYLRDTVDWFMGKTRRKDRENASEESKLYLQEPCLERKVQEDDLLSITEVPSGLDANEWHALHSEWEFISIHYQTRFNSFVQLI